MKISGWFFDAYPVHNGMIVWILDDNGQAHSCFHPFHPAFYLHLDKRDEHVFLHWFVNFSCR